MSFSRIVLFWCVTELCAFAPKANAQSQPEPATLPRFEVVSIKMNKSGRPGPMGCRGTDRGPQNLPLGRCVFTNIDLLSLFSSAFNQEAYRTIAVPDWIKTDRFDIEAKAEPPVPQDVMALMFQAMFFDRLKLAFHRETREVAGLALIVADDGQKLERAQDQTRLTAKEENTTISILDELTKRPVSFSGASPARMALLITKKSSMAWLANIVARSGTTGSVVVDKTGLEGYYAFQMRWQPEGRLSTATTERIGPTFNTALEEQLGLKLQSARVPVEVMVIDHLEKPKQN